MTIPNALFTSESVSEGHPDKIADQISDAILDALLREDIYSRAGCETLVATGLVVLSGEISSNHHLDYEHIVRGVIKRIGYDDPEMGFDYRACAILNAINKQSSDIAMGVNAGSGLDQEQGAGDQGLMFGYACRETEVLMPYPIYTAHRLVERQANIRKSGQLPWLGPDAKAQISVRYQDGQPQQVESIVFSSQHSPEISHAQLSEAIIEEIIKPVIGSDMLADNATFLINPTGRFVIGGPHGDCGLTGRKIIVDTYGGSAHHGGGAFSGKDPSKVDRSAAYAGRYLAKNIVAAELADRIEIQLAYAIGVSQPVSILVNSFGTGRLPDSQLQQLLNKNFDLTPRGIISGLDLLRPIYEKTAAHGHFGRDDPDFTWESTDLAPKLAASA